VGASLQFRKNLTIFKNEMPAAMTSEGEVADRHLERTFAWISLLRALRLRQRLQVLQLLWLLELVLFCFPGPSAFGAQLSRVPNVLVLERNSAHPERNL
jgi:hypothetical protein